MSLAFAVTLGCALPLHRTQRHCTGSFWTTAMAGSRCVHVCVCLCACVPSNFLTPPSQPLTPSLPKYLTPSFPITHTLAPNPTPTFLTLHTCAQNILDKGLPKDTGEGGRYVWEPFEVLLCVCFHWEKRRGGGVHLYSWCPCVCNWCPCVCNWCPCVCSWCFV